MNLFIAFQQNPDTNIPFKSATPIPQVNFHIYKFSTRTYSALLYLCKNILMMGQTFVYFSFAKFAQHSSKHNSFSSHQIKHIDRISFMKTVCASFSVNING